MAYTAGSGNSPAFGAAISQGGVSGVFLGAWTNWQSECIVPGAAIGATGFIKIGGVTGGNFAAGALTGIAATCSGPDVQGWIEVRGADTAAITVPRIGAVTTAEAWFELGTTNGARGQVLACPTTATLAGTFPGVWIETSAGSGVYERYNGVGSQVALATTRTDASCKFVWSTTSGIRIGSDGTNNVGFLPPTGCKVRIPSIILTTCTRTVSGSGPRVLPNATLSTRQEFATTLAGYLDFRGVVSQWWMNFSQAYYVKLKSCAIADTLVLSEIASPLDVSDCIVSPTQAQVNTAFNVASCFAGGTVQNNRFWRFAMTTAGAYGNIINYCTGTVFTGNVYGCLTLRGNGTTGALSVAQLQNCTFTNETLVGGRLLGVTVLGCSFNQTTYYDHTITTTTTSTNPMYAIEFTAGSNNNTVTGMSLPLPANGPYNGLVGISACYKTTVKEIGTYASPLALNSAVTGVGVSFTGLGNSDGIKVKRMYLSGTRTGPFAFSNSDSNVLMENCNGDYADTSSLSALNSIIKNCGLTGATAGQTSVYGTHWLTRFTSTTAGFAEILCNEPTTASAAQCAVTGGTPQFNSNGSVLLTKIGDQVTWELPFYAVGYTAFTNSAPVITGTNVTFGTRWGNHDIEFQVDTGSGYGGTWLNLTAANLIANTFNSTSGFKLKVRATCAIANAGNILTNLRVALTTTSADQATKLYPLQSVTLTISASADLTGSELRIYDLDNAPAGSLGTELSGSESAASAEYSFTGDAGNTVWVQIMKSGYEEFGQQLVLPNADGDFYALLRRELNT